MAAHSGSIIARLTAALKAENARAGWATSNGRTTHTIPVQQTPTVPFTRTNTNSLLAASGVIARKRTSPHDNEPQAKAPRRASTHTHASQHAAPTSHVLQTPLTQLTANRVMRRSAKLLPSDFRPDCPAEERLRFWTSPYGATKFAASTSSLPRQARAARHNALVDSVEVKTRIPYGAGLLRFHEFCDEFGIAEDERVPASEFLLTAFVASFVGGKSSSTVENWLCGLQLWHSIQDAPWHGDRALRSMKKAVAKHVPAASQRPPRPPVKNAHITMLKQHLDLSKPEDAAVFAAATTAY